MIRLLIRVFVFGIRVVWHFAFPLVLAECVEAAGAALNLAGEAEFVAVKESQGGRGLGEAAECEGGASSVVHGFVVLVEVLRHGVHFVVEEGGFHVLGAVFAPAEHGELFDEHGFGGSGGLEFVDQRAVEGEEGGFGLDAEADGSGGIGVGGDDVGGGGGYRSEAVFGGVGGGSGFAFGRDRPFGFFPVGAGGGLTAFG